MRPSLWARKAFEGRSFSKAPPQCPASRGIFPAPRRIAQFIEKPPESGGFQRPRRGLATWSEPLGAAPVATIVPVVVAVHPAVVAPPAALTVKTAMMGQDGKPPLLAVIERLVERIGGIGV